MPGRGEPVQTALRNSVTCGLYSRRSNLKPCRRQGLFQSADQLAELRRGVAGGCIHDVIVSPIMRLVETQLEARRADLLRRQLQRLQSGLLDIADEHQRAMQRLAAHRAPAAQMSQRLLPGSQTFALRGRRPQREEHLGNRAAGWMVHGRHFIRIFSEVEYLAAFREPLITHFSGESQCRVLAHSSSIYTICLVIRCAAPCASSRNSKLLEVPFQVKCAPYFNSHDLGNLQNRRELGQVPGAAQRMTRHIKADRRGMSEHATTQLTGAAGFRGFQ